MVIISIRTSKSGACSYGHHGVDGPTHSTMALDKSKCLLACVAHLVCNTAGTSRVGDRLTAEDNQRLQVLYYLLIPPEIHSPMLSSARSPVG